MNNRVNILCDFNNGTYDTGNASLLALNDFFHVFHYPNIESGEMNSVAGCEGDPFYVWLPFRVETAKVNSIAPIFKTARILIVAIKANEDDFIVEELNIDVSSSCLFGNAQQVNYQKTKGYQSYVGDPYNNVSLVNDSSMTVGTMTGYGLRAAFVLRYDYWASILNTLPGGTTCKNDINNDIQNVNNSWSNLASNGWSLVLRFSADVIGYDGTISPFQAQTTIECLPIGATPDDGPSYINNVNFYDSEGNPVTGIIPGSQTRISSVYTPDGDGAALPAGFNAYWGAIWADIVNQGGVTLRRWASTEIPSEASSPFISATPLAGYTSYSKGNATMNIAASGIVIIETIYDDTVQNWSAKATGLLIGSRLGFQSTSINYDTGIAAKGDQGNIILQD